MPAATDNPEIGPELSVGELVERTVVVLMADYKPNVALSFWVRHITEDAILFDAAGIQMLLAVHVRDGGLYDDAGHHIRAYKYLGEI